MLNTIYTYKTISNLTEAEFKDRGSRFLGFAYPITSVEDTKKYIKQLKELHPKAVHHCFAWRLGLDQTNYRANDDGEPSGSAGKPILGQLDSFDITNTLILVVRYFGGTLLGVPGLINAYKTVAHDCLILNTIVEKNIEHYYMLEFDYTNMNDVMRVIKQYQCSILKNEINLFCQLELGIALIDEEIVLTKLKDLRAVEIKTLN